MGMPEAQAFEADFTSTSLAPTDEELAIMMELKAEQQQLLETRAVYKRLVNYLHNDFNEVYKESCDLRRESDNLLAELEKTAVKLGFDISEEDKWTQSKSAQGVESIEDFFLRMLEAPGSESITCGDLPRSFPSVNVYSDSEPYMGETGCDCPNHTADDFPLGARGVRTAANATVGCGLASSSRSFDETSDVSPAVEVCIKAAPCALPNITEQNLVRKPNQCNPQSQKNPTCMPIKQHATEGASTLPVKPGTHPKLTSACGSAPVQRHMEVCQSPPQHLKPGGSCNNLRVGPPLQSLAMNTKSTPDSQEESSPIAEEHPHSYQALETPGALPDSSPLSPSISLIGGATTLVVRNIPAKYSKDTLMQELPPDGTYDFFYLPFSFRKMKIAGYLFLNFKSNASASAFYSKWHGQSLPGCSTKLNIGVAEVQGLEENMRQLINRNIKRVKNPAFLPAVFDGFQEVPLSEVVNQLGRS